MSKTLITKLLALIFEFSAFIHFASIGIRSKNLNQITKQPFLKSITLKITYKYHYVIGRLWTHARQAFSYGIRHVFIVIHWTMSNSSLNHNENMSYAVWKSLPYRSPQPPYYVYYCIIYRIDSRKSQVTSKCKNNLFTPFVTWWIHAL